MWVEVADWLQSNFVHFNRTFLVLKGAELYAWLNRTLAVGVGEFSPGLVKMCMPFGKGL